MYVSRCTRSVTLYLCKWRHGALLRFGETLSKLGRQWLWAGTGESVLDHWCRGFHGVDPISLEQQGSGAGVTAQDTTPLRLIVPINRRNVAYETASRSPPRYDELLRRPAAAAPVDPGFCSKEPAYRSMRHRSMVGVSGKYHFQYCQQRRDIPRRSTCRYNRRHLRYRWTHLDPCRDRADQSRDDRGKRQPKRSFPSHQQSLLAPRL